MNKQQPVLELDNVGMESNGIIDEDFLVLDVYGVLILDNQPSVTLDDIVTGSENTSTEVTLTYDENGNLIYDDTFNYTYNEDN